uniref:MSDIN-like toxin proprotein 3 n=1 Tax=Amanita exitialis TaxID=262245 RepID=MSD3_AMAEX|nr:RecName: Full=MSDIN-like toxin proprotein 3; Contains: RecName: Full=Toxin MSD3; Flags: Precursor [Amanita exitialis]AGW83716.1 MSDIN_like 3 peptide 3 [Amanita exitialis]
MSDINVIRAPLLILSILPCVGDDIEVLRRGEGLS